MRVLAIVHQTDAGPGVFAEEMRERGVELHEWMLAERGTGPPLEIAEYDAVLTFGGAMHADQDDRHPWLREENLFLQRLLHMHMPVLGVCLGAQLLAKAAHSDVSPMPEPEVGWVDVELTEEAADDPLFDGLPDRFPSFQWHYYELTPPTGSSVLARSDCCTQAFRLGDAVWGLQFHPEITRPIVESWVAEAADEVPGTAEDFLAAYDEGAGQWAEIGRALCGNFVEAAERVAVTA